MDENCLRQFKVAGMKFWLALTQVPQGGLQLCASHQAIAGNKGRGVILGGEYQFSIEGCAGHLAAGETRDHQPLGGEVKGLSRAGSTDDR